MVLAGKDGEVDLGSSKIGYIDNFSLTSLFASPDGSYSLV